MHAQSTFIFASATTFDLIGQEGKRCARAAQKNHAHASPSGHHLIGA